MTDDVVLASQADTSFTQPCLLPLLHPVRLCLHTFFTDQDAARLMRASLSTTTALLADYHFVDHVFAYSGYTVADVNRSLAVFARHHMRILCMCLPAEWNEPLVDNATGLSVLPLSLTALSLGQESVLVGHRCVVYLPLDGSSERNVADVDWEGADEARQLSHRNRSWLRDNHCNTWDVREYGVSKGTFNQPIPPAALPRGLRHLQFNSEFDQPLQVGSIPATVQVLQFGRAFNQPLEAGHLPASLTHLNFGTNYNQPILPGVLPASLRRLHLGVKYDQQLSAGVLPSQLQQLSFGWAYKQPIVPGVIPPSVTHVRLSRYYDSPLQVGSIPHGVVHLNLGDDRFNHTLSRGVLPTSLRELVISRQFNQPLQVGSLPDGLKVLAFHPDSQYRHTLQPGVLPASVVVVSMGEEYKEQFVAGGIPATVQWLRLPYYYGVASWSRVLPRSTSTQRIVFWKDPADSD